MKIRFLWPLLCLAAAVLVSGCGGPLVGATGRVTYKGDPMPGVLVQFWPVDGKRMSVGNTDADGRFKLAYSRTEPGVLPGEHTVTLAYNPTEDQERKGLPPELKAIFAKYHDPKKSTLKYEVKGGDHFDIELSNLK